MRSLRSAQRNTAIIFYSAFIPPGIAHIFTKTVIAALYISQAEEKIQFSTCRLRANMIYQHLDNILDKLFVSCF